MRQNQNKKVIFLNVFLPMLFGAVVTWLIFSSNSILTVIERKAEVLSNLFAIFSFSMIGFLMTTLAILTGLNMAKYRRYGYWDNFITIFAINIIELFILFIASIIAIMYPSTIGFPIFLLLTTLFSFLIFFYKTFNLIKHCN